MDAQEPRPVKRVSRACDYCRRKRLKCTADEVPCMNCRLYGASCTYLLHHGPVNPRNPDRRAKAARRQRKRSLPPNPPQRPEQAQAELPPTDDGRTSAILPTPLGPTAALADFEQCARELGLIPTSFWPPDSHQPRDGNADLSIHQLGLTQPLSSIMNLPTPEFSGLNVPTGIPTSSTGSQDYIEPSICLPGLILQRPGADTKFLGLSSIGATITTCLKYSADLHTAALARDSIGHLAQGIRHMDELHTPVSPPLPQGLLADPEFVDLCVSAYIKNVHLRYPLLDVRDSESWRLPSETADPIRFSRVCLLVAIGYLSLQADQDPVPDAGPLIDTLHGQTWTLISSILACPYIETVEILLLQTIYLIYSGKFGIAWVTCGFVIRVAQSLGLHHSTPAQLDLSKDQIQQRARLWEVAYALDAFLSLSEGRPPATIDHPHIGLFPRVAIRGYDPLFPDEAAAEIHSWHVQLAVIANRLSTLLRTGLGAWILDDLIMLDQELLKWRDSIPMEFRPEQENLAEGQLYAAVAWLHIQYFNLMRSVHWVSLVISTECGGQIAASQQYRPRIRSSEAICIASARLLIDTLNVSATGDWEEVQLVGIPGSYCMAAVSVIFGRIMKEPLAMSSRTNLEYLRAGTTHILKTLPPGGPMDHFRALFEELRRLAEHAVENGPNAASTATS